MITSIIISRKHTISRTNIYLKSFIMKTLSSLTGIVFVFFLLVLFSMINREIQAQILPDLMYYKFENNPSTSSVLNYGSSPVGTNPAPILIHTLSTGGMYDSCLKGTGGSTSGVNTGWLTNFSTGSWTIAMWISEIPNNTTLYYLFGDLTGTFRCFLGGAAGAGNITLRGTGITNVNVSGVAPGPTVVHFVYDSVTFNLKAYKNGVLVNTVLQDTLNLITGTGFRVGGYSTNTGLNGKMDEFRVYRRALTAAEVWATRNISVYPEYYNLNNGTSSNGFPFAQTSGKAVNTLIRANEIVYPDTIPEGQQIKTVHFRMSTAGTRIFTNLHILIAQTSDTSLTSGSFFSGPYDTVYYGTTDTLTSTVNGWMGINLKTPYLYDPSKSLVLFVGQCGSSGSGGNVRNTSLTGTGPRRVWSVGGCPFTANTGGDAAMINFGIDIEPATPMSGIYYVGAGQNCPNFKTLTNAVYNLNIRGVSGPVSFILTDAEYTSEILPITINAFTGANSTNTLTIKPNTGVTATISDSSATSVIKLNGADYVTIDGSNCGGTDRNLTIKNTNAASGTAGIWISSLGAGLGASRNTVKNCQISCNYNSGNSYGICIGGTSLSSSGADNDTITLQNNSISKSYYGIRAYGTSTGELNSLVITGNAIGSNDAGDYVTTYGIYGYYLSGPEISNNEIFNMINEGNRYGMYFGSYVYNSAISRNKIHGFNHTNTSAYYCIGIYFASGTSCMDNRIDNNAIYDLQNYGSTTDYYYCGIRIIGGSNYRLYYNSISLTGAFRNTSSGVFSKCLYVSSASTNLDIRNNIFYNAMTGTSPKTYTIDVVASSTFAISSYNDFYTAGTVFGKFAGIETTSFADWKSAAAQDKFSVNADPGFTSTTDLTPNTSNANCWNINGGGYPISSITTDINGVARNTAVSEGPEDIGAFKFTPAVEPGFLTITGSIGDGLTSTISFAGYTLGTVMWHSGAGVLPSSISAVFKPGDVPPGTLVHTYAYEHLDITQSGGTLPYTYDITLFYNLARCYTINVTEENNIRIAKNTGGTWNGLMENSVTNTTDKSVTVSGVSNGFSSFTFSGYDSPLPVTLASLTSEVSGKNNVVLKWTTNCETNNAGFDVERKPVSGNYSKIGFVKGEGSASTITRYEFTDFKLQTGIYYYRLKQTDINGNFQYFNLGSNVEIGIPRKFDLSQNYPNPFNPSTKIDFDLPKDSKVRLVVYDMLGKEISRLVNGNLKAGYHTAQFKAQGLSSGVYFYRLILDSENEKHIFNGKMVLLK